MKKDIFVKIKWSLRRLWPRFLTQKFAANIYKTKFADIMQNVWKSKMGGSVKADFFVEGLHSELRKKAQNSDFDWGPLHGEIGLLKKQIFFSSNICAIISGENIWNSHKHSTWPFSCLVPMKNCAFRPQKLYLEYLDAEVLFWNIYLKYLEADKMRGKFEESLMDTFND